MNSSNDKITESISKFQEDLSAGLLYTHARINDNTKKVLDSTSFLYALVELLDEKGLVAIEELDARKKEVAERLLNKFSESCIGLVYQDPEYDKYTFEQEAEVDCRDKLDTCKAACCRIPFALSKQDVREGIVHWDLGQPYLIDHGNDGYCNHLDRNTLACTVYENRSVPCRAFNCQNDKRIWLDFKQMSINLDIFRPDWPGCLAENVGQEEREIHTCRHSAVGSELIATRLSSPKSER